VLFNQPITTSVDDSLARLMLTNPKDIRVLNLFSKYQEKSLDTKTLADISTLYSADVATIYFLQQLYQNPSNQSAQDLFVSLSSDQSSDQNQALVEALKSYLIVFVPGLAYKQDTTTGANFARQRRLLTSIGIHHELIEVGEWDLVEDNAKIVADRLKILSTTNSKIIVVSASKGGLETAIALGKILPSDALTAVKSWINVGGILRGSPIADHYLCAPKCWLAEFMLWTKGKKINLVRDISYQHRKESFNALQFPAHIKIINFMGAPLATQIDKRIKSRYCSMKKLGPNDGLTPLADEIVTNGITVSALGLDHYFRDNDIDKKTLALALVAVKLQNE
jgi:ethanolamine utilization protein EutP (predicted NTPase)